MSPPLAIRPGEPASQDASLPSPVYPYRDAGPVWIDPGPVWIDAGTAGVGADAGPPIGQPQCWNHPETTWQPDPWTPQPAGGPDQIAQELERTRKGMVGRWHGVAATPWLAPYDVDIEFRADGGYSAHCSGVADDCCVAFYYGTNADTAIKRYRIADATLSGNVIGEIDIAFGYGSDFDLPAWQGELSHVALDAPGNGLRFEFQTSTGYGPLRYDLRRVTTLE